MLMFELATGLLLGGQAHANGGENGEESAAEMRLRRNLLVSSS